jgi:hypothetical protein
MQWNLVLAGLDALYSVVCNLCSYFSNEYYILSEGVFAQRSRAAVNNNNDNSFIYSFHWHMQNDFVCDQTINMITSSELSKLKWDIIRNIYTRENVRLDLHMSIVATGSRYVQGSYGKYVFMVFYL